MSFINPATIADQLTSQISRLYLDTHSYLSEDHPTIKQFLPELEKLGKVDGVMRMLLLARLSALTGNREQVDYYLRNAKKAGAPDNSHDLAALTALLSLGYYSEMLPVIRRCLQPDRGLQNLFFINTPANCPFHILEEAYLQASKLKISNLPSEPPFAHDFVSTMDAWGDTDDDYAAVLDIAGQILRERKLFVMGTLVSVNHCDEHILIGYRVDTDIDTAIDMTCDFAERLAFSKLKIPSSLIFEFVHSDYQKL